MNILLYNWASAQPGAKAGGGVGVYIDNLGTALIDLGHVVTILSSGDCYNPMWPRTYVAPRRCGGAISYFDIVNSPVVGPSFVMFDRIESVLEAPGLRAVFKQFLQKHGPFDIVHFQNIEGLSYDCLGIGQESWAPKLVVTNHNYNLICQQVNLWFRDAERCENNFGGHKCVRCDIFSVDVDQEVLWRFLKANGGEALGEKERRRLRRRGARAMWFWRLFGRLPWDMPRERVANRAKLFRDRRRRAIEVVNETCARVVSVSKATEKILLSSGLDPRKSEVCYIGTAHYQPAGRKVQRKSAPHLRLAFLGYTRPDKGFHFLVSAIEAMPDHLQGRLSLLVAAVHTDLPAIDRLRKKADCFASLEIRDGYAHSDLANLLSDVDLGLVLPLWDDSLPQVAIEFVCYGVPILVSDRGGQSELVNDDAFVAAAGNIDAFWCKVEALVDDRALLQRFWQRPRALRTNEEHAIEMSAIYSAALDPARACVETEKPLSRYGATSARRRASVEAGPSSC